MSKIADLLKVAGIAIITDASALDKESKNLAKAIKKADERIRDYLLSEMVHIEEHRNPSRLNKFFTDITYDAKGDKADVGARVNAMHSFVQSCLNVKFNPVMAPDASVDDKKTAKACFIQNDYFPFYLMRDKRDEKLFASKMEQAISKPWWKHQPEKPAQNFDLHQKVETAIAGMWRAVLTAGKGDKVNADELELLADFTNLCVKHGFDYGKLVPNVSSDKMTELPQVKKVLTVLKAENSNVPEKQETPAITQTETPVNTTTDPVVKAEVEPKRGRGRGRKAA